MNLLIDPLRKPRSRFGTALEDTTDALAIMDLLGSFLPVSLLFTFLIPLLTLAINAVSYVLRRSGSPLS